MPLITVFTPTFNRAYILPALFESLCRQSCTDFEWVVVDDGSSDNTAELVASFIKENPPFEIVYERRPNAGKHRAINRGVSMAKGELFFIVDSDDHLTPDAIEFIASEWNKIPDKSDFVGISGYRIQHDGTKIGGSLGKDFLDCSVVDLRFHRRVMGDMAEAWLTAALRDNPFPEIEGEKFITEAVVWNKIGESGIVRYCDKGIYVCEYLSDGLTAAMTRLRRNNPKGCELYYSEESKLDIPALLKIKSYINFWRFAWNTDSSFSEKIRKTGCSSLIGLFPGIIMRLLDNKKLKN